VRLTAVANWHSSVVERRDLEHEHRTDRYAGDKRCRAIAECLRHDAEDQHCTEHLERASAQRDGGLAAMKGNPLLKNLEADPRYTAFLMKMRLPR
jgi:hypothetical protein